MAMLKKFMLLDELLSQQDDNILFDEGFLMFVVPGIAAALIREEKARIFGYVESVVGNYIDSEFRRIFRMSRQTFETILSYLKDLPELAHNKGGRPAVKIDKQLLITLWYIGSQDTINKIADRFGVSESTVIGARDSIVSAVLQNLMQKLIIWPDQNEQQVIMDKFERRNGFPGIVGCIDGTHIKILPPKENKKAYFNRKHYYSIQLQCVCREDMTFIHAFTGYPGSCHDSRILRNSDLWELGPVRCRHGHIIGDGGYPVKRWLLTPYRDNGHLTPDQRNYNRLLSSNRSIIERAFGLLKGRFRRLLNLENCDVKTSVNIIVACCVFHNVCILQSDGVEEFMTVDDGNIQNRIPVMQNPNEGFVKRDFIARNLPR